MRKPAHLLLYPRSIARMECHRCHEGDSAGPQDAQCAKSSVEPSGDLVEDARDGAGKNTECDILHKVA